mmetsp:Transcript_5193/g.7626  ORF Transcript_5193/g.7626 Transcript_5193/m.7626 type:complete len:104 (-) Transcript_5193:729-1040(-)
MVSHESNAEATAPTLICTCFKTGPNSCPRSVQGDAVAIPSKTSEWPPKYLVAECTTMSAPSKSGWEMHGGAIVESTTVVMLLFVDLYEHSVRINEHTAAMSIT